MNNKIRNILLSSMLLLFMAVSYTLPASAQFNAFKDPTPAKKVTVSDTDLVAVEKDIKGGRVVVGETAHFVVIFKNRSASPVKVNTINLYPSSTVVAAITLNQCVDIPLTKDSQCAVTVSVTGKQGGAWRVEMLVEHEGPSRITTATISGDVDQIEKKGGKSDANEIALSTDKIDFGTSPGGAPVSKSITIKNNSADDIKIKSVGLNVAPDSGFSYSSLCRESLSSEASCNIIVTWDPTTKGEARGVLTVDHTGRTRTAVVEIVGKYQPEEKKENVDEGEVKFSTDKLDFGSSSGDLLRTRSLVLTNESLKAVRLDGFKLDASVDTGFSYKSKCPRVLESQGTCVIVVSWQPVTAGLAQGVISVKHSGTTAMDTVELTGEYNPPAKNEEAAEDIKEIEVSTEEVDFGTMRDSMEKFIPITITNNSSKKIEFWDMYMKASELSGLSHESECFDFLAPKESCSVMLKWKPTTEGLAQGAFVIFHSGKTGSETVKVTAIYDPPERGEATAEGSVIISPEALDFGTADNAEMFLSRSVQLTNNTSKDIKVDSIAIESSEKAGFDYKSKCPTVLKAGSNCVIVVGWQPLTKGSAQGVLTVNHSGREAMANLELSGTYDPPSVEEEVANEGDVEISPDALDFGTTDNTLLMYRSVVLSNHSNKNITINNIDIDADKELGFGFRSKCPKVLKAGGECVIIAGWKPNLTGAAHGVLTVSHNGRTTMSNLELTGIYTPAVTEEGEEGSVVIAPEALDFGSLEDNNIPLARSVVLSNSTENDVTITNIAVEAPEQAGFRYKSKCPTILKAGSNCVIVVGWKPEVEGAAQGVLTVNHSGREAMANLELSGVYSPPEATEDEEEGIVEIAPEALDFGSSSSELEMSRSVILSNNTFNDINIESVSISATKDAGFSYNSQCPTVLKAGSNCVIVVNWKSVVRGASQGVLFVKHSGKTAMASLELSGTYDPPTTDETEEGSVAIAPEALDFGTNTNKVAMSRSVVLTNDTEYDVNISDIAIEALNDLGFTYKSKCPATLKAGSNCVIVVNWDPKVEGAAQGVLTVNHSGTEAMANLEISGTYTPDAAESEEGSVAISPESLDFGSTDTTIPMLRSVVLSNTTQATIDISSISIDSPESAGLSYKSRCPAKLTAGAECVIVVEWKPNFEGATLGVLTVNHSGKETMATLEISGTYAPATSDAEEGSVAISPDALDFGTSDGSLLMSRSVVLSNTTSESIDLTDISIDATEKAGFTYNSRCPKTLTAGGECVIVVRWYPQIEGTAQGVLTVNHSGKETMATLEISGTYTADAADSEEGSVAISPDALDFGTSDGGLLMSRSVVLSNTTSEDIYLEEIEIESSDKAGFDYKSKCPSKLTAGGECVLIVNWKPEVEGLAQGVLTVKHSGKETMANLEMSGTYTPPSEEEGENIVVVTPESLDFGTSDGSLLMSRSLVLTNKTADDIDIVAIEIDASERAGFSYSSKCPEMLSPEGSCTIVIKWEPFVEGSAQGVVNIYHTGKETMTSVEISGDYAPPADDGDEGSVSIDPDTLEFGTSSGGIPISRSVILRNTTEENISIGDISIEASERSGFDYKSKCPVELAPGGSCIIILSWKPTSIGLAQGVLTVNHSGKEGVVSLEMTGTLTPDEVTSASIYPNSSPDEGLLVADKEEIDFGSDIEESSSVVVSLVNSGNAKLTIHDMTLSGISNGVYFSAKGCYKGIELQPGSACPLTINWLPKRIGPLIDSLQITHSGARGVLVIPLVGTASAISEIGIELEKKQTMGTEANVFFEDYFYDNLYEKGFLEGDEYLDAEIDISEVSQQVLDLEKREDMEDIHITTLAADRAVLRTKDGNSIIVRDGGRYIIEGIKWNVSITLSGVILSTKSDEIVIEFDNSLRPMGLEEFEDDDEDSANISSSPSIEPPSIDVDSLEMINP